MFASIDPRLPHFSEDTEDLPAANSPNLEAAAARALKDYRDDEDLRVAIVLRASPKELLAQLATGERVTVKGEGLRLGQAGLTAKADPDLAITPGAIVRLVRDAPRGGAAPGAAPTWRLTQWPEVQAALVAMDAATGRVRALVGGFDFTRQPFNHVTQAQRQPGSSFKPFLYSAALESGVMPATLINDAPFTSPDGWQPQNSDGQFDGPMTLRQALARSKNLVSIRVLQQVGVGAAGTWAERFGFAATSQPDNLTMALGAGSASPMRLAQAYGVLANGGWAVSPVVIERITDAAGKVLFEAPPAPAQDAAQRVVPERNVFITNSLLNDVTRVGTAARAQGQLGRGDVYGKTGTTNDAVDAWFGGFQAGFEGGVGKGIVAVVWMGHDDPQSLGLRESGGGLALPVWIDYMAQALKGVPAAPPPRAPEGVVRRDGDWVYAEFAEGGGVTGIGLDEPAQPGLAASPDPTAAAAGAAAGTAPADRPALGPVLPVPVLPVLPAPAAPLPAPTVR